MIICIFTVLQTIQYKARGKILQSETRELASLSRGKVRPGESDEWSNEQLYVPPLPPTNLRGCHLIKIQYDVYVSLNSLILVAFMALLIIQKMYLGYNYFIKETCHKSKQILCYQTSHWIVIYTHTTLIKKLFNYFGGERNFSSWILCLKFVIGHNSTVWLAFCSS